MNIRDPHTNFRTLRTPYPLYHVLEKITVLRTKCRTLEVRYPSSKKYPYSVPNSVPLKYGNLRTPYPSYSVQRVREYGSRTVVLV